MNLQDYIAKNVANDAVGHVLREMAKQLEKLQTPPQPKQQASKK